MSAEIIVSWKISQETGFPVHRRVFNLVCTTVAKYAKVSGDAGTEELCQWGRQDGRLLLVDASNEVKKAFSNYLREALNDGTIISEILSWPTPDFDASLLLPEHRTPQIISFICNNAAVNTLRRLTLYLDKEITETNRT